MPIDLYQRCAICAGTGSVDPREWPRRNRPPRDAGGRVECFACQGERYLALGMTLEQVEGLIASARDAMAPRPGRGRGIAS